MKASAQRRSPNPGGSAGFTLLELIIVLFLTALMVGMGIIAMTGRLPSAKLDATVREMSATMRQARSLARTQMLKQSIVIDLDARSYGIEGKISRKIPEEIRIRIDDPLTGDVERGVYHMFFSPHGRIEGGAVVMTAGRKVVSVRPDPVMGFTVSRGKRD
jgi:general secretion pathway protein H